MRSRDCSAVSEFGQTIVILESGESRNREVGFKFLNARNVSVFFFFQILILDGQRLSGWIEPPEKTSMCSPGSTGQKLQEMKGKKKKKSCAVSLNTKDSWQHEFFFILFLFLYIVYLAEIDYNERIFCYLYIKRPSHW